MNDKGLKYDASGNVTYVTEAVSASDFTFGRWRYTYDNANQLIKVEWGMVPGVDAVERAANAQNTTLMDVAFEVNYTYNAEGKLVKRDETWLRETQRANEYGVSRPARR